MFNTATLILKSMHHNFIKNLLALFILMAFSGFAQQQDQVDLVWKVKDMITYKTIMNQVRLPDTTEKPADTSFTGESDQFIRDFQEQAAKLKYITKLFKDNNGAIDIEVSASINKSDTSTNVIAALAQINNSVILRGKLSPQGEILSFYYKTTQRNLIATLFELPPYPVKTNDSWSIDTNLLAMDQNYVADSIYQKNNVFLERIIEQDGDKIAVVKYDIEEYISGDFGPAFMTLVEETDDPIFMKMTYIATGHFSINKGQWIDYSGTMALDSNFSLFGAGGNQITEFELLPLD